jgi:hypothetical protein
MRIVVDRGRQPGSVMGYLLRTDKREKGRENENPVIHTNMFGEGEQELTEELRFSADQNHQVEKTYVQYKISFPPGENPNLETKIGIVDDVLDLRGHGQNCQFFAVEHFEKIDKHDVHHLHILASTVRLDGSWVDDAFERVRLKDVERAIEQKRGLQDCTPQPKGKRTNTSIREVKLKEQGQILTKDTLRTALDEALADQPSMPLLMMRIKAQGYAMQFHEFEDGKGISFGADGRYFKGRQLGDRFSFNGLHEYAGVDYQPERDDPMIRQLNQMSVEQCQAICNRNNQAEQELDLQEADFQQQLQLWETMRFVTRIWEQSRVRRSQLKALTFEDYQIRCSKSGEPELYRGDRLLLGYSEGQYHGYGLTQQDCRAMERFQAIVLQQVQERLLQLEAQQLELEQEKERERGGDRDLER